MRMEGVLECLESCHGVESAEMSNFTPKMRKVDRALSESNIKATRINIRDLIKQENAWATHLVKRLPANIAKMRNIYRGLDGSQDGSNR